MFLQDREDGGELVGVVAVFGGQFVVILAAMLLQQEGVGELFVHERLYRIISLFLSPSLVIVCYLDLDVIAGTFIFFGLGIHHNSCTTTYRIAISNAAMFPSRRDVLAS